MMRWSVACRAIGLGTAAAGLMLAAPLCAGELASGPFDAAGGSEATRAEESSPSAEEIVGRLEQGERYKSDAERDRAEAILREAASREPAASRWRFGLAMHQNLRGERAAARDALQALAESEPGIAAYQFWYGTAIFETIGEMGVFAQISWNGTGRAALVEAVRLDPGNPTYRFGLAQYYINAPGIAGGSYAMADEQARALLALPEGRGKFLAHLTLAGIAASKEDWPEVSRQFAEAEDSSGVGASRENALRAHAQALLMRKKDPDAAIPIIERYLQTAAPDNTTPHYFMGLARQQKKEYSAAIVSFQTVLSHAPESRNTRYALAQCYQAIGNNAQALIHYEEFSARFPDDSKAAQAKAEAKKLRKTLK